MALLLIVTADDLGIDPRRDDGILVAYARGAITQASLMVRGRSAESAADAAHRVGLPLGLHLDLTETPPSAPAPEIATLLGADGRKLGKHGLRAAFARGDVDPSHVGREAIAQIDLFARLTGARPSHVDGHQHAHIVPGIAEILAPVLAEAGIYTTRIPSQRDVRVDDPEAARFYRGVSVEAEAARPIYARSGVRSTEAFAGLDLMGTASAPEKLASAARAHRQDASLELMCHPGYVGEGVDDFNESPAREHELAVLCARPFADLIAEGAVKLGTFADLAPPR